MRITTVMSLAVLVSALGTLPLAAADLGNKGTVVPDPTSGNPGTPGSAHDPSGVQTAPMVHDVDLTNLTGTVRGIDQENKRVQLQDSNGGMQILKVGRRTKITRDGSAIRLSEIKQGDQITVKNAAL